MNLQGRYISLYGSNGYGIGGSDCGDLVDLGLEGRDNRANRYDGEGSNDGNSGLEGTAILDNGN